jgi:hypothetical protein
MVRELKKRKLKLRCYFCGREGADTKEHIPPKKIFSKEIRRKLTRNLITVPAHTHCNNLFSHDDDLFGNLIIAEGYRTIQGAKSWDEIVVSSFTKNPGARKRLIKRFHPVLIKGQIQNAYILRDALTMEVSLCESVVTRIIKGLYYYKFNEPLPQDISISISKLNYPEKSINSWNAIFSQNNIRPKWIHVAPNIFSYFYGTAKEDKTRGICLIVFYNTVVFQSLVGIIKSHSM